MAQVGTGKYTYDLIQDFPKLPPGESLGIVSVPRAAGPFNYPTEIVPSPSGRRGAAVCEHS
jgi:hypothetical protein